MDHLTHLQQLAPLDESHQSTSRTSCLNLESAMDHLTHLQQLALLDESHQTTFKDFMFKPSIFYQT